MGVGIEVTTLTQRLAFNNYPLDNIPPLGLCRLLSAVQ